MTRSIEILAVDWRRLRQAYPGVDERELLLETLRRGQGILEARVPEQRIPPGSPARDRLEWLRRRLPRKAASVAVHLFDLVTNEERFERAAERERETYERHLELDRNLVPPLKQKAKALRAEVRLLETELRALGVDPDGVEPQIDWSKTLAVDAYERPRYETNESRRRAAVEFFRRRGEP